MILFKDTASARRFLLEKGWTELRPGVFKAPSPDYIESFFEKVALDMLYAQVEQ